MEVLIAAIILNLVGKILKRIPKIKDNFIPIILSVLGVIGFAVYYGFSEEFNLELVIDNGLSAAAMSVFLHQVLKQLLALLPISDKNKKIISDIIDEVVPKDE